MGDMMAATMDDVARLSQVSAMTVSRVINSKGLVAENTKKRILSAIEELNYRPNLIARGLITQKTETIGVLISHFENPLYSVILAGINKYAAQVGMNVILGNGNDEKSLIKSVNTLINKRIDGLIILPVELYSSENNGHIYDMQSVMDFHEELNGISQECRINNIPVVLIGDYALKTMQAHNKIYMDYKSGAKTAVQYLFKKGHRKIGQILHINYNTGIWKDRYNGFFEGMLETGCTINIDHFEKSDDTVESAYEAGVRLFSKSDIPTALYCSNDLIAVGMINAANQKGLRVPEDISIIGHDGSLYSEMSFPKLTTVSICPLDIGLSSMKQIYRFLNGENCSDQVVIQQQVIEGQSVAEI